MISYRAIFACALVLTAHKANAAIVKDGIWTGKDWYNNTYKIGVQNGVPYSNDPITEHMLRAPLSLDSSIDAYLDMKNVQTVQSIFPAS